MERTFTEDQQKAYDEIMSGNNTCVLGIAGAGKSYLINEVIRKLSLDGKKVCVVAPTGIAALNVGGSTIHRLLRIGPNTKLGPDSTNISHYALETLESCDVLIVDEISMCRADLFDYLISAINRVKRYHHKHIQIICVGDFFQLPPVVTDNDIPILREFYGSNNLEGYSFNSMYWKDCNFKVVNLSTSVRQSDSNFVNALNLCRLGNPLGLRWIYGNCRKYRDPNAVILCSTNKLANSENMKELAKIPSKSVVYHMLGTDVRKYEKDVSAPRELVVKVGARVMTLVNDKNGKYQNGSMGVVEKLYKDNIQVKMDSGDIVFINRYDFEITRPIKRNGSLQIEVVATLTQFPIKLAYAITMHKSQGQTLDSVHIYPDAWVPGQMYTALSRAKSVESISFEYPPDLDTLTTSKSVLEFFRK